MWTYVALFGSLAALYALAIFLSWHCTKSL